MIKTLAARLSLLFHHLSPGLSIILILMSPLGRNRKNYPIILTF